MDNVQFHIVTPNDDEEIALIAAWYLEEWGVPQEKTISKLKNLNPATNEFHVLMTLDGIPVATGGVHHYVSLLDREPRMRQYSHWLALVYSIPECRGKGFGAALCEYIHAYAQTLGLEQIVLFTHTAEPLYKRLGWQVLERLQEGDKDVAVMQKIFV